MSSICDFFPLLVLPLLLEINKMKILTLEHCVSRVAFACVHNGLFIGWMPHLDVIVSFPTWKLIVEWITNNKEGKRTSERETEQASKTADIFKKRHFFVGFANNNLLRSATLFRRYDIPRNWLTKLILPAVATCFLPTNSLFYRQYIYNSMSILVSFFLPNNYMNLFTGLKMPRMIIQNR